MTASPDIQIETDREVERIRASQALGPRGRLLELFDYLVARSRDGASPKEAEIAASVFGKAGPEATRDDPVARVYIHRLRKRLEDFYLREDQPGPVRLEIPRGEYRIIGVPRDFAAGTLPVVVGASETTDIERANEARAAKRDPWRWAAAAVALLAVNIAGWAVFAPHATSTAKSLTETRLWGPLAESKRPLLVVVGDYYIFGEYEDRLFLKRLVRDFSVNSKADLMEKYLHEPGTYDKFADVSLQYLPTSAAYALADLSPILAGRDVQVELASNLTPEKLKTNDIIYVGLFSGLGALKGPVFTHSRFELGESYDEVLDRPTHRKYVSEAFLASPGDSMYRDYGIISAFSGPTGNRIVVLAGARDTGLMGVSEAATRPASAAAIDRRLAKLEKGEDAEALFEVKGQKHVNLESAIVVAGALNPGLIWSPDTAGAPSFPAE